MTDQQFELPDEELERRDSLLALVEMLYAQQGKLFLRHNLLVPELERMLRWSCIQAALTEPEFAMEVAGKRKQKPSHAAVRTGLSLSEVKRAADNRKPRPAAAEIDNLHRMIHIMFAWRNEPRYQGADGKPIDLPVRGSTPSLHQLCQKYARGVPTRPIADALVKNGNAAWIGESEGARRNKKLRFLHQVVTAAFNTVEDIALLTQIGSDFMHSFQQTFDPAVQPRPRFREGFFNDIDINKIDEAQKYLHDEIQAFNARCLEGLKKYRAASGDAGIRLGVGAYSYREAPFLLGITPGNENDDTD
ncbi:MAG TPA: DUF6502 family protein [Gammaproteobacteria bacterium]